VDVHGDGYEHEVQHGIMRASFREGFDRRLLLEPGKVYELAIDLGATSYVFKKGNITRVEISSSDFDRYDRNLNTGAAPGFSDQVVKAEQTVYHSEAHPSRIILPVKE
jgi:putative CocE/NonD family hydrolase